MLYLVESGTSVAINKVISGKKGGGGGGSSQTLTPDTLRSSDTVEVILGISEGPIYGLAKGGKSLYVGDTQYQNEDGSYNFTAFQLKVLPGVDVAEPVVPVLGGTSSNKPVNLTLATNVPVTRQTESLGIDFIDIRLAISQLMRSTSSGTFTASVTFRIEYKALSSSTWLKAFGEDITITGKTGSNYIKELRIAVPKINEAYQIRVTKLSHENTTEYFCTIGWESFQEVYSDSVAYNNTAIMHLVAQASDQFSSIPTWSGVYKGLLIKVPENYDPVTRTYTGAWSGNFKLAWSNNPAWCLYDFIMNDRYGMKAYYSDISLDKFDTYEAGQWCDELVPDGQGGTQPRYTFNAYLTEARTGKELAKYMAGAFNATLFDDLNGLAFLKVDKDDDALHIFTKENVTSEGFEYTYTDLTTRYNDITVTFKNPELSWAEDRRRVYRQDLIDKHGRIPLDFIAVGCTNAHEAVRRAWYKLITSNTETCIVNFKTNRLGQFVNPFDVILVCDPDLGYGLSGRIKTIGSDSKSVTLRDPVYLEAGVPYVATFQLKDGSNLKVNCVDTVTGYNYTLKFSSVLPIDLLVSKNTFTLEHPELIGIPRPFRVMSVKEDNGNPDSYSIEAIVINRNKWYDADNITDSGTINYSSLPSPLDPPGPTSVTFSERYVKDLKQFWLTINPTFNRGAYKYYANDHSFEVWSRRKNSGEDFVKQTIYYGDTLIDHPAGLYEFKILGKSYFGKTSQISSVATYEFRVTNPKEPPAKVDWVKINSREVYWGYNNPPEDFKGFIVRYHNVANRTTWDDAIELHTGFITATNFYTNLIPNSARVIMVKAIDDFDVLSEEAAIVYRQVESSSTANIVEQIDFHPTWSGTKTGCAVEDGVLKANDTGGTVYSGNPNALMYPGLSTFYISSYNDMIYEQTINITKAGALKIIVSFDSPGYELSIKENGSTAWQPVPNSLNVQSGVYNIRIRIPGGATRGILNSVSVIVDVEDIYEDIQDVIVPSSGIVRVPITKNYSAIKIVNVIIQDDGVNSPVSYRILDKNPILGPEIILVNKDNIGSAGLIDVQIKGY